MSEDDGSLSEDGGSDETVRKVEPSRLPLPLTPPPFENFIPEGDTRKRSVCRSCGQILYQNPRIVVGAVCVMNRRFLLVRRAIEPRIGAWTFPCGYMEMNETTREGAAREVREEAGAHVEVEDLLAVYSLPHISQVHMMYRARMLTPDHAPGEESLESRLFEWSDIPWDDLAFPTTHWTLRDYARADGRTDFAPFDRPEPG
ncbi:NUDIX hydrolase [Phaeovibrio sulfidiphilus]|uniref:NUDIX hydrolase n=1 Tax=Phaeovibrio sulfidiphilus TaxID=1220600 RepID=A0A8J7CQ26_9PROT|nr:NUDIX hydrolase [Phaeovibrio sulfidiphilus]MBE1237772.1 NUDIX hydrolase [Phaeovibrio sulfidiphilus]